MPGTPFLLCLAFIGAVFFRIYFWEVSCDINSSRKAKRGREVQQPLVSIQAELKTPAQPLPKGSTLNKLLNLFMH